ncbi:hypothetical protein W97_01144 [Coniosporium apollinis CBS 100218]|uniref:Uncharacterized protein n=1 Tax=Coniosporium apollinis (strain CBS 100218) TaxID=1168221 RepID=R7YJU6_CONA1|nr:uncharacterized protein W97_01144 [Coniosporium apollinis CBS 100218]EON61926.1 hypothetical protein W97_01144 [Coniosporium apollinis CBS 100218]
MFPFEACSSLQQRRGSFRRHTLGQSETSRPIFDPEAKHYMDPEARAKLRLYLASPQKFDEVLEFGFPSTSAELPSTPPESHPRHKLAPRQVNHDVLTFLQGDPVSFLDDAPEYTKYDSSDSDEDTSTIGDGDSPVTPRDGQGVSRYMRRLPSSNGSSLDNTSFPLPCGRQTRYAEAMAGNREMTLRVTLTRPDLRAADDELYGWQKSGVQAKAVADELHDDRDPLALEALPPMTDDITGSHCPFTTPPPSTRQVGLVRRLLKKMRSVKG